MRRSTAIALTAANPGLAGLIVTASDGESPAATGPLPYETWAELERIYPHWRHKKTDPNCARYNNPTNWLTRWWVNRHRDQVCASCEQHRTDR